MPPGQAVRRVVSPGAGKGPIAAHLAKLAYQAAAGVVAPTDAAAGVAHAGALPYAVGPLVVAVADRGGVGNDGGAIPPAGIAVALPHQAVEAVVGQAGYAAAGVGLFHQVVGSSPPPRAVPLAAPQLPSPSPASHPTPPSGRPASAPGAAR